MSRTKTMALVLVAAAFCAPPSSAAQGRGYNNRAAAANRQRAIAALQAQLGAARQTLSAAQTEINQAQGKIDDSKSRVETAKSTIDSAKSEVRSSHQTLEEIEARLLEKAGPGSDVGKARAEFLAAEEAYNGAKKNVLESATYKTQIEALDPSERSKQLPLIQKAAFKDDSTYQNAKARLSLAKVKWAAQRTQMVQSSPEWMAASKAVKDARLEENKADGEAKAGALARMPAAARLRDARDVAQEAAEAIAACEFQLRQLGVNPSPPPKPTGKK
jgi:chromosome segregation ATPase